MLIKNHTTITIIPEGVVGKLYTPRDNSYNHDLTAKGQPWAWIAGHTFVLTCQPYEKQVHDATDLKILGPKIETMVQGMDPITGRIYEMMYHPGWIQE